MKGNGVLTINEPMMAAEFSEALKKEKELCENRIKEDKSRIEAINELMSKYGFDKHECPICKEPFGTKGRLEYHMNTYHN